MEGKCAVVVGGNGAMAVWGDRRPWV